MKKTDLECVLLVDDDEATNFINKRIVNLAGVKTQIEVTVNGQEALDYLGNSGKFTDRDIRQPGIIFLDINMPRMDGWEFLKEYKKIGDAQKAKIVIAMLTTSLNPEDELKAREFSDVKDFLKKPLTIERVQELVNVYFSN